MATHTESEAVSFDPQTFERLVQAYRQLDRRDVAQAWHLLEALHVLGQTHLWPHARTHGLMLGLAWRTRDLAEWSGQLFRLLLVPLGMGLLGMAIERLLLSRLYERSEMFQMLLTFGLALVIEGSLTVAYGSSGLPYDNPLPGGIPLGFMFLPLYRAWVVLVSVLVCLATWLLIERTRIGMLLRAATERPDLLRTFGVRVPLLITATYGFGVALAALAGVLAAPIDQVKPLMGSGLIVTVFAVVVIGGMGSIFGAVCTGFVLGVVEALTRVVYPPAAGVVIFLLMAAVIAVRPAGLFGKAT